MNASRHPATVSDVMTRKVVAVTLGTSFKEIVRTLEQWKVSALPVVADGIRVVGVVSEADLLRKEEHREDDAPPIGAGPDKAAAVTAEQLMTATAVTVREDAPVAQAARAMALHRVKRLPVVDADGALQGVVSRGDLLKVLLRADEDIARDVRGIVMVELLPEEWQCVDVEVADGIVTVSGLLADRSLVPVVARLVRSVEGVVDVRFDLTSSRV
ncbi:CBS domain-containing protein [Actinacidiphila glaucinigra]|uniref:CBS domain-containing protein n=1 Tax=Actinacidiphila glaucinigra TaxID=235986 RepID=UPI002DD9B99A|nr:CBS domain-containing protein [Actinacidiphila glaucinigra]WSD64975.1 CBS domain-containing protein [Actinacidiphila glaucinigra]